MAARIQQVPSGEINTWIIGGDEEVVVIDPARDPSAVLDAATVRAAVAGQGHETTIAMAGKNVDSPIAVGPA